LGCVRIRPDVAVKDRWSKSQRSGALPKKAANASAELNPEARTVRIQRRRRPMEDFFIRTRPGRRIRL